MGWHLACLGLISGMIYLLHVAFVNRDLMALLNGVDNCIALTTHSLFDLGL